MVLPSKWVQSNECNYGYKHVPDHAYLINRDPYTFNELRLGDIGVGQFLSLY